MDLPKNSHLFYDKEQGLTMKQKMDAGVATGVFLDFPRIVSGGRGAGYIVGLYREYLRQNQEESRKRKRNRIETAKEMRKRILQAVEKKIIQDEEDDLFVLINA